MRDTQRLLLGQILCRLSMHSFDALIFPGTSSWPSERAFRQNIANMKETRAPTPYFEPPPQPDLLSLPAELLHGIFGSLDIPDVLAARLTCSLLAAIGLDHFGHEVPLVFHRESSGPSGNWQSTLFLLGECARCTTIAAD